MMMCKLLLAAALVSTADAQIMKAMASCGMMASKLDTVCQAHGHKVPTKCASKACANVFLPFYRKCGKLLVAIEHQFPNSAQFSNLYDSCIEMEGDRDTVTGKLIDKGINAQTVWDFRKAPANNWRMTVDGVMGGRSHGTFSQSTNGKCNGMLFQGSIELTHGGFVNVKSPDFPSSKFTGADGIRICSKSTFDYGSKDGKGDLYKVRLYDDTRSTYAADFHTSEAGAPDFDEDDGCDGIISTLPFSQFWPSHWGRRTGQQGSIHQDHIHKLGLDVSFVQADSSHNKELDHYACTDGDPSTPCKNNNPFGLCVQWVQTYKNKPAQAATTTAANTITVSVINGQNVCGESTIPKAWGAAGVKYLSSQNLNYKVGSCKSQGYTTPAGQKTLYNTGAPSDPTVKLYRKAAAANTVTVHIINSKGQCGQSTIPKTWASSGVAWIRKNGFVAQMGSCASAGYTTRMRRSPFALTGTGAPSDPTVTMYTLPH